MTGPPEFHDLFGDDLPADDRARLERVHDLLVAAGPPPELPPSLAEAPDRVSRSPSWLPRRRLGAALALAATIATVAFLGGYVAGFSRNSFDSKREVTMQGTSLAPAANGLIKLGKADAGGNWPMVVEVRGLPTLPGRSYYELYLTRNGKPVAPCGGFDAQAGTTTLKFTVPYNVGPTDGWVVTRWDPGKRGPGPVLLST
ncbi:MAG TPA: hypothetical protein VN971_07835 [Thermoanaerobaculia bacterium]|nr:hypothetical protein [Thermoanaerobaculia bacterium]